MDVDAIAFDTGGTVLDWHTGLTRELVDVGRRSGVAADWADVARTWRRLSTDVVKQVTTASGGLMDDTMDDVLRETLAPSLEPHGAMGVIEHTDELVRAWRHCPPWPDAVSGIAMLRRERPVVAFTILRTALIIEASRRAGLEWDAVFSCEMTGVYKTAPAAYLNTASWLDRPPHRILLAATHNNDISAARQNGFRTAFIYRPDEWGNAESPDPEPGPDAELVASDIVDLARQLERASGAGGEAPA